MTLWLPELTCTAEAVHEEHVWCAEVDGDLAGFYRAIEAEEGAWSCEGFWIHPTYIGRGIGKNLLRHAIDLIADAGGRTLRIASDPNAQDFYIKMGARRIGDVPSQPKGRRLPLLELRIDEVTLSTQTE